MNVIGYAYDADIHCEDCTERRFPGLVASSGFLAGNFEDSEGNEPSVVFEDDESDTPTHCGDCHVFLGGSLTGDGYAYVVAALRDVADGSANVLREWFEEYSDAFDDDDWQELARAWFPLVLKEGNNRCSECGGIRTSSRCGRPCLNGSRKTMNEGKS